MRNSFRRMYQRFLVSNDGADPTYLVVRDGYYEAFWEMAFEMDVSLGVCGFIINICDNLANLIFNEDSPLKTKMAELSKCLYKTKTGKWPSGVVANVLDCDITISKFKLQSRFYGHLWTDTVGKGINAHIPSRYRLNSNTCSSTRLWH